MFDLDQSKMTNLQRRFKGQTYSSTTMLDEQLFDKKIVQPFKVMKHGTWFQSNNIPYKIKTPGQMNFAWKTIHTKNLEKFQVQTWKRRPISFWAFNPFLQSSPSWAVDVKNWIQLRKKVIEIET